MKVFAIGDLHLSGNPPAKPMDVFGPHWSNHWENIQKDWRSRVTDEDIVFIVGDISWALRLEQALFDLQEIMALPGQKYMIRGNHDYWWSSVKKMDTATNKGITFLQGHSVIVPFTSNASVFTNSASDASVPDNLETLSIPISSGGTIAFGGSRGYLCPNDSAFKEEEDRSIYERELMRTEAALQEMGDTDMKILLLHYPPFNDCNEASGFTELIEKYNVKHCIFGHLHDQISFKRIVSNWGDTQLHLVSADYMNFTLKQIL